MSYFYHAGQSKTKLAPCGFRLAVRPRHTHPRSYSVNRCCQHIPVCSPSSALDSCWPTRRLIDRPASVHTGNYSLLATRGRINNPPPDRVAVRLVLIYSPPLSSDSLSPWCRSPTKSRAERPRRPHPRRWSDAAHVGQSSARKRALPAAPSPRSRISLAYTLYFFSRRGVICAPGTACAVNRNIYLEGFTRVKKKTPAG